MACKGSSGVDPRPHTARGSSRRPRSAMPATMNRSFYAYECRPYKLLFCP
jgi:hypothetical protein